MSGFFWNIRGFNNPDKHKVVKDWIRNQNMQFGCLLETRVNENRALSIANSVFQNWSFLSNYEHNRLGRIWVTWSPSTRVTPVFKSSQLISCSILLEGTKEEFLCSFIYAFNTVEERRELWEDLKNHQASPIYNTKPWLIFGDFNEILDVEEHSEQLVSPGMKDFQNLIQHCSLMDMNYQGPLFTWNNKREDGLICKKLDRSLINMSWLNSFPQAYSVFESGGCSDHLRCRIRITADSIKPRRPFKFINAIADNPEFLPTVQAYWENTEPIFTSTSSLFRFSKKLKELKPILRSLSKDKIGDIKKKTKEAYDKLCELQMRIFQNSDQALIREERCAYDRWSLLSQIEEKVISQQAKLHWLNIGDGNNKQFYNAATVRNVRNSIKEIQRADGSVADSQEEIKIEAVNHFHGFLSHQPPNYQGISVEDLQSILGFECNDVDQAMLTHEVTEEDIQKVLFSMAKNKSPGPDGYSVEFFKAAWPIIKKDFVLSIQSFFEKGFLPKGVNSTILALIPKKEEAIQMKDYRHISCCNVLYKIISKLLANRLKRILPKFISPTQSAFVKDRLLMENVLLASELVKSYHKNTISSRCAVKIDIAKAFDSVQWPFLLATLSAIGLPEKFILWIQRCITMASFSVQVNGELASYFNSNRGLRQGCSLSPYLFVICMHVLSRMLDKAARDRVFGYHPYCSSLNLTHLCFADDMLVFSDGKKQSIEGILKVFTEFAAISGLSISLEKSTLFMAGVSEADKGAILNEFPFDYGTLPVRYLGLPLMTKQMRVSDYSPLIERIKKRISSWTVRHLSFAGRLQLIASVIHSLINFWLSAFRLPKACIKEIDSLCGAFLWSGPSLNTGKAKVSWSDVCKPKKEGGLGLRSLTEVNKVCSLKLLWRIVSSSSSLWVQWIQKHLFRKSSIWSLQGTSSLGSWIWKKLLKYRDLAYPLTRVTLGNGATTSFWYDTWSPLGRLLDITGLRGAADLGIALEATVQEALQHRPSRHRTDSLNLIEAEIDRLKQLGLTNSADIRLWKRGDDKFTPKFSSKETLRLIRGPQPHVSWHGGVWFSNATPKFSFVVWLAIRNRLATGDRITSWNATLDGSCILCPDQLETRDHLFFSCTYSGAVWRRLSERLLSGNFSLQWDSLVDLAQSSTLDKTTLFLFRSVLQTTVFSLWKERNRRKHGESPIPMEQMVRNIDKQIRNRILSLRLVGRERLEDAMIRWLDTRTR